MKALLQESRQPARSSAPPSGPTASGSFLTPCRPPRSTPPSGPAPASASSLASVLRFPPTSIDRGRKRIGYLFRRVRSFPSRFAAGRSRPQVEPFRHPTAIPLDPKPTSAASVHTDFVPKSFARKAPAEAPQAVAVSGGVQGQCRPLGLMWRVRSCQSGLQGSGSVTRTGVFWLSRERLPLPSR